MVIKNENYHDLELYMYNEGIILNLDMPNEKIFVNYVEFIRIVVGYGTDTKLKELIDYNNPLVCFMYEKILSNVKFFTEKIIAKPQDHQICGLNLHKELEKHIRKEIVEDLTVKITSAVRNEISIELNMANLKIKNLKTELRLLTNIKIYR
jgi:hypothetical protein